MVRTSLGALAALAIAALVGVVALLPQPGVAEAQSHSATRTFQQDWAAPRRRSPGHHHRQQLRRRRPDR